MGFISVLGIFVVANVGRMGGGGGGEGEDAYGNDIDYDGVQGMVGNV